MIAPADVTQVATVKYELGFDHLTLAKVDNPTRIQMDVFIAREFKGNKKVKSKVKSDVFIQQERSARLRR